MFDGIINWSLENRLFVILGAGILLAWGAIEAVRMPVDVFPDLTAPTVTVITEAHGMAPEEVETLVTFPTPARSFPRNFKTSGELSPLRSTRR